VSRDDPGEHVVLVLERSHMPPELVSILNGSMNAIASVVMVGGVACGAKPKSDVNFFARRPICASGGLRRRRKR
jgi:hypothetical protein